MPPRPEPETKSSANNMSSVTQDLVNALHELIRMQQRQGLTPMQLDTRIQLPKYSGQMNGEVVDSWIYSLSTYFRTHPDLDEERKLQIASLQLEGLAQTWWDTQLES
jgi:hypothetical protein